MRADARPAAVLWDMDGTLVDTEPYWMATEVALAEQHGTTWTHDQAMQLVGSDLLVSGQIIRDQMGLEMTPAEIVEYLLDGVTARVEKAVPWRPGARELLAELAESGVPTALVTMSYRRFVDPILLALRPLEFDAIVTGDAVARGKPFPDPYLEAARLLDVDPAACLAIEDSVTGCDSAEAAGCVVLAVPCHVDVPPSPRRVLRESLAGLDVADLPGLMAEAPSA
ncbi:HAD family phosphatase [Nocardioides sp. R-C-SC26]|uniref:HAD family hydrolase n=1 Tax=Nocardioides sp. R-C-SC26 TaxID=2870414 RepID=UPI001E4EA9BB|nr:HAD family phosphatase [Nocardioides sp. R-C-SC26]